MVQHYRSGLLAALAAIMIATLTVPAFVAPAGAQADTAQRALPDTVTYSVTITNATGAQPFTPPVLVTHDARADVFTTGEAASPGIQGVAENGDVPGLVAELEGATGVNSITVAATEAGPLLGGESITVEIETGKNQRRLSVASMLICTNDGFVGLDSMRLPRVPGKSTTIGLNSYDAGTELNTELFADMVPPCGALSGVDSGGQGTGESNPALAENGVITRHEFLTGAGDLDLGIHNWEDPAAMLTVTRIDTARAYEVTITNNTTGQPFTPPVAVTHNRRADLFEVGEAASPAIQGLAENGDVPGVVGSLAGVGAVRDVVVAPAPEGPPPILPGNEVTFTIYTSRRGGNLLSIGTMLICTNDGFTGIDSLRLPRAIGDSVDVDAVSYDAGTEINTELFADMVPPCGDLTGVDSGGQGTGATNPALAENGVIGPHAGITGAGDLDPALHGWSDPVASVSVVRVK